MMVTTEEVLKMVPFLEVIAGMEHPGGSTQRFPWVMNLDQHASGFDFHRTLWFSKMVGLSII